MKDIENKPNDWLAYLETHYTSLKPYQLSYAAEALGCFPNAVHFLGDILAAHPVAPVREGAVLGLAKIMASEAAEYLRRYAKNDPSEGVRTVALECLGDLTDDHLD